MGYDLNRIEMEIRETCKKANVEFNIPVKLNGKLTRTLGRVHQECHNGIWEPISVEFSKQLLETTSDKSIRDVVLHETAHVIATIRTGELCGHNSYFKRVCAEIGTTNDGIATEVERTVAKSSKYEIFCPTCHKTIGEYSRMCKTIQHIEQCHCKGCGKGGLKVIQNW